MIKVPIEISARHIHLSQEDLETLFGPGHELKELKPLSQTGTFASEETLDVRTEKGAIQGTRILGPVREKTQAEVSKTDARKLGINPPVRKSGNLVGSGKATLVGPKGNLDLGEGVIVAARHIHASPGDIEKYGLKEGQVVSVKIGGERGVIFENVLIRVNPDFVWNMHVDTDEANAAGIEGTGEGEVIIGS